MVKFLPRSAGAVDSKVVVPAVNGAQLKFLVLAGRWPFVQSLQKGHVLLLYATCLHVGRNFEDPIYIRV